MIDVHAHVLPGLDDGPADVAEALALLRVLAAEGVTTVCATPHVTPEYPTTADARDGSPFCGGWGPFGVGTLGSSGLGGVAFG